ncbi:MAG: 50S ribosomal protein L18 [Candidatus Wolfebacteria bacterium GW2011_GWC2_46_275]|uniref:Large ribosomal subunit protein uL18 n=2 Tax=Candidatus Wolfeibacteriota TaxID=1752735 RepID=A0A0G1U903_9BACT|nr:MAG: 50S ribosomal protein L18, large subunit ribosomal protein L18 [Candidatus Wolfebacteria bacterium GW2011_GWB1_47_1]KKU36270.1 MAG: 50S ribosomal protein L18 [Candidatus Wolfebacteria bacterium GW2011_GWC2_46_275]KKU42131.1 MAG: 50S ribosomal protein L18 [Candidatus Wolfebacteria bacterium GW2011_GWB2_46_69]KKU54093.1 MAG: 50S ribosomal protein L18 [Candidatus Wolfebacteria bacterium GW2011_GWC1_47_103]KKU59280.1 MAG: 50S ribosomal protein L18 [Candidatus Wolfebacteria bacterium GW2011_
MNKTQQLNQIKERRRIRTRAKLFGTMERPRLSVLRTNQFTSVQLIDDMTGKTLASASTRDMSAKGGSASGGKNKEGKITKAEALGEMIAKKAKEIKINAAVFDRGGYNYHGRVKAVAEGARKGGLQI